MHSSISVLIEPAFKTDLNVAQSLEMSESVPEEDISPGLATRATDPLRMHPIPGYRPIHLRLQVKPRPIAPQQDEVSWAVDLPPGEKWILPYEGKDEWKCKFGRAARWVERRIVKGVPPL